MKIMVDRDCGGFKSSQQFLEAEHNFVSDEVSGTHFAIVLAIK